MNIDRFLDKYEKYLPSKKFVSIFLVIVVLVVLFLTIKETISLFRKEKSTEGSPTTMTVGNIIQKDSNNNGIADWEEYLWGLDPNKNGPENKEFISSKKKILAQSGKISTADDSKYITQNELLSQEFFATIVSLQQTGELNEDSIQSVSDSIGQKITATPIADVYTKNMLTIEKDSEDANINYFIAFMNLTSKYEDKDIGSELTLVSQGIGNNDPQALYAVNTIASAYRSFGSELVKIPVPNSASPIILSIANNYEKTAQSIEGLTKILSDPIIGMRSLISYKKYNDALISDIEKFFEVLK